MGSFMVIVTKAFIKIKTQHARDIEGNVMKDISGNAIVMRNGSYTVAQEMQSIEM